MINTFKNIVLGIPDETHADQRLYILKKTILNDCYAFCINRDCLSFDRKNFDENLLHNYRTVFYFDENSDSDTSDSAIWYKNCGPSDFIKLFRDNEAIIYGLALNIIEEIETSDVEQKLERGEWKAGLVPPHVVYSKDTTKKSEIFESYLAPQTPLDLLNTMASFTNYAQYMLPLLIRLTVELYFVSRPSLEASLEERELVARLEIRTQARFVGKVFGTMIRLNRVMFTIPSIYKHIKLARVILNYLFKLVGSVTNIEKHYNKFQQECLYLDFDLLSAAHMYLFAFAELRYFRRSWYTSVLHHDVKFREEPRPEEYELTDRFCILLQLVRHNRSMGHEA